MQLRLDRLEIDLVRAQKHNQRLRGHAEKLAARDLPAGTGGDGEGTADR